MISLGVEKVLDIDSEDQVWNYLPHSPVMISSSASFIMRNIHTVLFLGRMKVLNEVIVL